MKEIIKILKNYKFVKKEFFAWLFFGILAESIYLALPQFSKKIISIIENKQGLDELYFWLLILTLYIIIAIIILFLWEYFWNKLWLEFYVKKQNYYRQRLFQKNYKDILDIWTWKLITRLENGVFWETEIFFATLTILVSGIYRWFLALAILAYYIPELIIVVVFAIVFIVGINFLVRKYIKKYSKKEQELWEEDGRNKAKIIMDNLVIRLFWKEKYELKKWNKILKQIPDYWVKVDMANTSFYLFLEMILRLLEVWVFFTLWTLIIKNWEYSIAYLVMITSYIWFLKWPLDKIVSNLNRINKVWEKYKKLQEFINKPNEIKDWEKEYIYKKWEIEFENVDFAYNKDKKIFENLNLKFLPWKKNALVGHSWGWKSTIVKLILRLYDYQKGEILIDNQELKSLKIESFYKYIWYLPQEPWIFDGTIRENMEYAFSSPLSQPFPPGEKGVEEQEKQIWEALEKAQIADMVRNLEKWLETEVWEKWIKLSWWEKQRLAIARIFLKNPKIIILDEPTSALDSISESEITKALDELMKWRTSIVIAHRLQTVMYSDKIIVLENGKIEAEWIHEELMKKSKVYKTLVDLQNGKIIE